MKYNLLKTHITFIFGGLVYDMTFKTEIQCVEEERGTLKMALLIAERVTFVIAEVKHS